MVIENLSYRGWDNCLRLTDGKVELIVTLDVGPRVLRFGFVNGQNLFKIFEDQAGLVGGSEWRSYGGHRLWHAPEVIPRSYYPDNQPVAHVWDGTTLRLTPPTEMSNGLQLSIEIKIEADSQIRLRHMITNVGVWEVELAPWCLSVMAAGGRAVFPQEDYRPHPECVAPARSLTLWHFVDMSDPRWIWGKKYIQLQQDDSLPSKQKIGAGNTKGWAAYILNNEVFIKRFRYDPNRTYPDKGCNCEFYTEPGFLEIESLGPLARLAPGATVEHFERWRLYKGEVSSEESALDRILIPFVDQTSAP